MKFTLKGFFSVLMLIVAVGSVVSINADSGCCGSTTGSCGTSQGDCGCTDLCDQSCAPLTNSCNVYGKNFYLPRSQGSNLARQMIGIQDKIHKFGNECFYGVGTVAFEYQRTFISGSSNSNNRGNLGSWFSSTGNARMSYGMNDTSGSNTNGFDLNALNWGYTGSGEIYFCPTKDDFIIDLNLYLGLDELFCGLWAQLDITIVRTKFNIGVVEKVEGAPSSVLPTNLFNDNATDGALLKVYDTFKEALRGDKAVGDLPILNSGKICGSRDDTSVANIRVNLGYDWMRRECWHFATSLLFVAPVGTKPCGEYLFEPLVGNAARFEIGGEVNFGYELWNNCDATQTVSLFIDGYVDTVVARRNRRILGLLPEDATAAQRTWSQYLLLKVYDSSDNVTGLERAANITTGDLRVAASVEGAVALLLQWNCNCLMAGIGYEAWGRSCEKAKSRCFDITSNKYALQGVTDEYSAAGVTLDTNAPASTISTPGASTAQSDGNYLTSDSLDVCPALHTNANSNKVFAFAGYNWCECDWQPFILVGGEAEFGSQNRAVSQWGVIGKGGISF